MTHQIFSATGCARCNITKRFMKENGIDYEEYDFKADGKDTFAKFYRAHRGDIYRDKDGVEFPIYTDGRVIRQGVSVVIGHLIAGDGLDGFIGRSALHGDWIDGLNISGGDPSRYRRTVAGDGLFKAERTEDPADHRRPQFRGTEGRSGKKSGRSRSSWR